MEEEIDSQIKVPPKAKFKVYWHDYKENFNKDDRSKIKKDLAKKYGISASNIEIIDRPMERDSDGNEIDMSDLGLENVMDVNHQRKLFYDWVQLEGKKINFDRLMELDEEINAELDPEDDEGGKIKRWRIKELSINNFLSFGNENEISFDDYQGLTVVTSDPANQGGKTTFCVDAVKFLLFGKTTKTDKNEQVFNEYTDDNNLEVKGKIEIGSEQFYIERKMSKSVSKSGNVNINNKVNYYRILPDGEQEIMNDEDSKSTQKLINDTIGNEEDFESVIMATDKNLENLIDSTPTKNGKLINRFIGLDHIFEKESLAREKYNEFSKRMLSNTYDVPTLKQEIDDKETKIDTYNSLLEEKRNILDNVKSEIESYNQEIQDLNSKKKPIDEELKNVDKDKLEKELSELETKGKNLAKKREDKQKEIDELGEISYDEDKHEDLNNELNELKQKKNSNESEINKLSETIHKLKNDEICPTCKRPLDDVDHSDEIKNNENKIEELKKEVENNDNKISELEEQIKSFKEQKEKQDKKNKLEIELSNFDVEIKELRNEYRDKKNKKDKFEENVNHINENKEIDRNIENSRYQLSLKEGEKDKLNKEIQKVEDEIDNFNKTIEENNKLIEQIEKEKEIEKVYKVYIEMVGKKGICKLVLNNTLPLINGEVQRLLDDVCDFNIYLEMNHRDEVQFYLQKDGNDRLLKSGSGFEKTAASLALRCVLGKLSNISTPNFIVFDEVLGKVSEENMESMRDLLHKITDMYETIFFITHYNVVKDWADNIITVKKEDNISSLA